MPARQTAIDSHVGGRYHAEILTCQVIIQTHQGAGVAQLVEQRFRKPQVARSIRVAGSIQCLSQPTSSLLKSCTQREWTSAISECGSSKSITVQEPDRKFQKLLGEGLGSPYLMAISR